MVSVQNTAGDHGHAHGSPLADRRPWLIAALFVALSAMALYPVFSVTVPPLVDYPNHLARIHILAALDSTPALQKNYAVVWPLQPNQAMDILLPPLARSLSIYDAGRLFIAATFLLLIGGTLTLHKVVHGRIGLWPAVLYVFLFSHVLYWGFLNFLFTSGLYLFAFSGWIALRERPAWLRLLVFSVASIILFFGHLLALGLYGLSVLGYELWRERQKAGRPNGGRIRDWSVTLGQYALPGALFLSWAANHGSGAGIGASTEYGPLAAKATALLSPVWFWTPAFDLVCGLLAGFTVVWARHSKFVSFAPALKGPVLLLAIVAVLMPHRLLGVWGTDFRIPAILIFLVVAGVHVKPMAARPARIIACTAILLLAFRVASVHDSWRVMDQRFEEFRNAAQSITPGASLLTVLDKDDATTDPQETDSRRYWHMAGLAVIERSAFFPYLFTGLTTVDATPARQAINTVGGHALDRARLTQDSDPATSLFPLGYQLNSVSRTYWTGWPELFDYVLVIRFQNRRNPMPQHLSRVHEGSYFDIYRVLPRSSGS